MSKSAIIVTILILVIVSAAVIRIALESPRRPNVSIAFLDYTNDSSGIRIARFVVSNSEASTVEWPAPIVSVQTPTGEIGHSVRGGAILGAGALTTLTIPPPTNQSWRIHLRVYPDIGTTRELKRIVTYALLRVGLRPRYQTMPYGIDSDWIESEK